LAVVERALAESPPDATRISTALEKVTKREADRLIRESGVGEVDPADRRELDAQISNVIEERLRRALVLDASRRAEVVRNLTRGAIGADLAAIALDRWLGFDERPSREPSPAKQDAKSGVPQLAVTANTGELRVIPEGSRIVAEVGGAGAGNGYIDAGEWVELAVSVQNSSVRPWFSTTAYFRAEDACVLAPAGGIEAPELAPRGGTGSLRVWLYFSRECSGAPRRVQLTFRDTHRASLPEVSMSLVISPLEVGIPRLASSRFDTDELGFSDGSRRKDVSAALRFEFSSDLVPSSGDPTAARIDYLFPRDLRPLFVSLSYRDEPLVREEHVFRPADDLDGHVVLRKRFDEILEAADRSSNWVKNRESPRLWLAMDASFEVPRPGFRAVTSPEPPKPAMPLAPDVVAALARSFMSLEPHPVEPELRNAISAASGLELVFDSKGFQAAYREALFPTPRMPPPDPCSTGPASRDAAPAEAPPPLVYRHRLLSRTHRTDPPQRRRC
jgi:hypothetical protein